MQHLEFKQLLDLFVFLSLLLLSAIFDNLKRVSGGLERGHDRRHGPQNFCTGLHGKHLPARLRRDDTFCAR